LPWPGPKAEKRYLSTWDVNLQPFGAIVSTWVLVHNPKLKFLSLKSGWHIKCKFAQNEEPCTYYLSYPLHLWKKIVSGSSLGARTSKKSVLGMRTHAMWDPSAGAKFPELYPGIEISCPMLQRNWWWAN
jgi:hypothetical protein